LTTDANELMAPIHNRMPVIVGRDDYDVWLDPAVQEVERLQPLLRLFRVGEMTAYPVSTVVNNPKNDVEECVKAVWARFDRRVRLPTTSRQTISKIL
jgi:putative SOS response-associated peptidase YedK